MILKKPTLKWSLGCKKLLRNQYLWKEAEGSKIGLRQLIILVCMEGFPEWETLIAKIESVLDKHGQWSPQLRQMVKCDAASSKLQLTRQGALLRPTRTILCWANWAFTPCLCHPVQATLGRLSAGSNSWGLPWRIWQMEGWRQLNRKGFEGGIRTVHLCVYCKHHLVPQFPYLQNEGNGKCLIVSFWG